MSTTLNIEQTEDLTESWVDLQNQTVRESEPVPSAYSGNLEKLLIEAQRESRTNSKESSARGSPKSPNSPTTEWTNTDWRSRTEDPGTDWIWDWSSRPEIIPQGDWNGKFRHPTAKPRHHLMSMRKSKVLKKGIYSLENLPTLLLSHAATFFLGAAVMLIYIRKYCHLGIMATPTID